MTWDVLTQKAFNEVDLHATEATDWAGAWDTILHLLFPHEKAFGMGVVDNLGRDNHILETTGKWTIFYIVNIITIDDKQPVFILEINPYPDIDTISTRANADSQMRDMYNRFTETLRLPRLYGISAMGPKFSVYSCEHDTNHIYPVVEGVPDTAPAEWWAYDIMSPTGEAELRRIVAETQSILSRSVEK